MKKIFAIFGLFLTIQAGAVQSLSSPVQTVDSVDLHQYLGKWYEIAAMPQFFEKQCARNTVAQYAEAEGGLISVINSCDTAAGQNKVAQGRAKVVDTQTNAKLKVTFIHFLGWHFLVGGDYWILGLGPNYSYAVIGAPQRNYAWILSRTPAMTQDDLNQANQILVQQGFDTCKLISTVQSSGLQKRTPLCQLVSGQ